MPKALLDYLGYAIYFWIHEGSPLEPVHVHVSKGRPTPTATKIWLAKEGARVEHNNSNIPQKDLRERLEFINENRLTVIGLWLVSCLVHIHNNCSICGHLRRHRQSP